MRAHVVESGVITNTVEVNALSDLPNLVAAKAEVFTAVQVIVT